MRSHCSVFVDVGYLLAASATRVTGTSLRGGVVISYPDLVSGIIAQAERESGLPVLRIHWYDSGSKPGGAPDHTQEMIGELPRVKLRLGRLSPHGEQKGVDLRIGLDLASHGRNKVSDLVYLLSGDDDLTEAVEEAQGHGVQVVILAVPDAKGQPHAVARHLVRACDDVVILDPQVVDRTVMVRAQQVPVAPAPALEGLPEPAQPEATSGPAPEGSVELRPTPALLAAMKAHVGGNGPRPRSVVVYSSSSGGVTDDAPSVGEEWRAIDDVCRGVIAAWRAQASEPEQERVRREQGFIPNDLDRTLLTDLSVRLGIYDIGDSTRYALRAHFWEVLAEDE
ncbi:MAG: NYN domain-containing protein [Ornithinibacter sp.]